MRHSHLHRQKLSNGRKRPHLLDLIDHFYGNWVELVPRKFFSIRKKDMLDLERKLGVSLNETSKEVIEDACMTFVNAVVLEAYGASRRHLASYACSLSKVSMDLIDLLVRPNKVSDKYGPVRDLLLSNSAIARLSHSREDMLLLAKRVQLLSADILRVSHDHKPAKSFRGGQEDRTFIEFTMHFYYIAKSAGASMKLPRNEFDGHSTPLRDFAVAILEFAIEQGNQGINSMKASESVRKRCRIALRRYLAKVPLITEYLRAPQKRQRIRTPKLKPKKHYFPMGDKLE